MCLGSHDSSTWFLDKNAELGPDASTALRDACKILGTPAKDITYNWSRAQALSFTDQLTAGVRYFDLRLSTKRGTDAIYLVHGMYSVALTDCLGAINKYLSAHQQEVVLIDMNHFYGMDTQKHRACLKLIMATFGEKLCPRLGYSSLTLQNLWRRKLQVIVFYHDQSANVNDYFWSGDAIPSPWPNVTDPKELVKYLDSNYRHARSDTFYVTQGVLTPDVTLIVEHPLSTLRTECSEKAATPFVTWLSALKAGPQGINVCIMDFVQLANYIETVIGLNQRQ